MRLLAVHEHDILYADVLEEYGDIFTRYMGLNETDGVGAYELMRDALSLYERFSFIKLEVRREETKGKPETKDPPFKDRLDEILRVLKEINQESRMVWKQAEDDREDPAYKHI